MRNTGTPASTLASEDDRAGVCELDNAAARVAGDEHNSVLTLPERQRVGKSARWVRTHVRVSLRLAERRLCYLDDAPL